MSTTSPNGIVIENRLKFLMSQETTQNVIYASTIQSFSDDKVFFSLVTYTSSILSIDVGIASRFEGKLECLHTRGPKMR